MRLRKESDDHAKAISKHGEALARIFGACAVGSALGGALVAFAMKMIGH